MLFYRELTDIERVHFVPALGSKLPPFCHHSVEIAQREQDDLELRLLAAHLQRLLVEVVQGFVEISLKYIFLLIKLKTIQVAYNI